MKVKSQKIIAVMVIVLAIFGIVGAIIHASLTYENHAERLPIEDGRMLGKADGGLGNPPDGERPDGDEIPDGSPDRGYQNFMEGEPSRPFDRANSQVQNLLSVYHIIIITVCCALVALSALYLLMSWRNQDFYHNTDKLMIYILGSIISTALMAVIITMIANTFTPEMRLPEETSEKDEVFVDTSNIADGTNIDLSKQTNNVTITQAGTYTFTGKTSHSIVINAPTEDVELILNNVEISSTETAAIIGLAARKITITSADGSKNSLSDGGNSEYDGCIFSNAELVFGGNGTLEVSGNQNEGEGIATEAQNIAFKSGNYHITSNDDGINAGGDGATITFEGGNFYIDAGGDGIDSNKNAIINGGTIFVMGSDVGGDAGIDTDGGYTINGGTVIALGSDMVEAPLQSSQQKSLVFTLGNAISKDTIVSLMKDGQAVLSFTANKSFKTIIISSDNIVDGSYQLYTGGTHTGKLADGIYVGGSYKGGTVLSVANQESFKVSGIVSQFGSSRR